MLKQNREGFTLIELMVVIAIIGILMGILMPVLGAVRRRAQRVQVSSLVKECELASVNFRLEYGQYPWTKPPYAKTRMEDAPDEVEILTYDVYKEIKGQGDLINSVQDYLGKIPSKFVKDKGDGDTLVDLWDNIIKFRVNPEGMAPVVWSFGQNKTDETNDGTVPAGRWMKKPPNQAVELDGDVVMKYYYYGDTSDGDDIGTL